MRSTIRSAGIIRKMLPLILLCMARGSAAQVLSTISIPITSCCSVDVNSNTNRIFTSGGASPGQVVTMIDGNTNTVMRTLGTGSTARVDPIANRVYAGAVFTPFRGFLVYDGATGNLITSIATFDCPIAAAVDPASHRVWGAAQCGSFNDAVFVVDANTEKLLDPPGRIGSGGVMGNVVVNPVTHIAYIYPSAHSKKVDPRSFAVSNNPFSGRITAANPVENRLYAWDQSNLIQVIDGASEAVLASFRGAGEAAVNPKQNRVYVADRLSHSVLVLDGASNQQLGSIPVPGAVSLGEIAVNSTTGKLYLAMADATRATLSVIKDNVNGGPEQELLASLAGSGTGTVTSSPAGINCGPAASQCAAAFPGGTHVTLTPAPAAGSAFGGWSGCDSVLGAACTVTLSNVTRTVTATFNKLPPPTVSLSIIRNGSGTGTMSSNPAGLSCPATSGNPCSGSFPGGTHVTLTPAPAAGSSFGSWSGCDSVLGATCTVTLSNVTRTVTATFNKLPPTVSLSVIRSGSGTGTVSSNPVGLSCAATSGNPCSGTFPGGARVVLTATPTIYSDFGGWNGCDSVAGTSCTVTLTAATTVYLTFNGGTPVNRMLQVMLAGAGAGTVTSLPGGISCPPACLGTFLPIQQTIILTPTPAMGSAFGGWSGCDSVLGPTCTVMLSNVTKTVTATFTRP
jgi:uncharacterized protein (DUF2141 family)